jgi:hypothetical protein
MKHDEMQEYVWKKLGPRKWLVGKREVNLLTRLTIENWQSTTTPQLRATTSGRSLPSARLLRSRGCTPQ